MALGALVYVQTSSVETCKKMVAFKFDVLKGYFLQLKSNRHSCDNYENVHILQPRKISKLGVFLCVE